MTTLDKERLTQNIAVNLLIIDNFYENPFEVREFALGKHSEFISHKYHPGIRTSSYATPRHKEMFNDILEPFCGKIVGFNLNKEKNNSNGAFQLNTAKIGERSWIHHDNGDTNWAGIIYLTPNAPLSGGTGFYKLKGGDFIESNNNIDKNGYDNTKWEVVSTVGNIFNRLVLFRSNQFHMSLDYFGDDFDNGRLIQLFFLKVDG